MNSQFSQFLSFYKFLRIHKNLRTEHNHNTIGLVGSSSPSECLIMPSEGVSEGLIGFAAFETSQSYYKGIGESCQVPTVRTF